MWRRADGARVAVWVFAALWLAGCSIAVPGTSAAPTPAQELKARLSAFVGAHSVALDGTLSASGQTYHVTLNEDDAFHAEGTLIASPQQVAVDWTGQQLFLQGADYFKAQKLAVGTRWVLTHNDKLQPLVTALANRRELAAAVLAMAGSKVTTAKAAAIDGVQMVQFASDRVTVTAPASGGAPVRLATALDQPLSDGLSDLKLAVTVSGSPAAIPSPPTSFVDLADLNTLPANYEQVTEPTDSFRYEGCDARSCTLGVDFHNNGGRVGTSQATFAVEQGTKQLGSCTVAIPAADHNATTRAGCRVSWNMSLNDVQGYVEIMNPA